MNTIDDKAKELVDKFRMSYYDEPEELKQAKQCALICVEEIIKDISIYPSWKFAEKSDYWQKVKEKIQSL